MEGKRAVVKFPHTTSEVAKVITEQRPRAQVKSVTRVVSEPTPRAQVKAVTTEVPIVQDKESFVARCRELAGLKAYDGFMESHMMAVAQAFKLAPVRFVYERRGQTADGGTGHLMTYVGPADGQPDKKAIEVYDPEVGIKKLVLQDDVHKFFDVMFNDPTAEAQYGPEHTKIVVGKVSAVTTRDLLNAPPEEAYQLNRDVLLQLGALQATPYDCGPLAVYAAWTARSTS